MSAFDQWLHEEWVKSLPAMNARHDALMQNIRETNDLVARLGRGPAVGKIEDGVLTVTADSQYARWLNRNV